MVFQSFVVTKAYPLVCTMQLCATHTYHAMFGLEVCPTFKLDLHINPHIMLYFIDNTVGADNFRMALGKLTPESSDLLSHRTLKGSSRYVCSNSWSGDNTLTYYSLFYECLWLSCLH